MATGIKSVSPSRVGRYYHLECPRYLRYSSTARADRATEGVPSIPFDSRPVHRAVLDAGYVWEDMRADANPPDPCRIQWVTDLSGSKAHRYNTNRSPAMPAVLAVMQPGT